MPPVGAQLGPAGGDGYPWGQAGLPREGGLRCLAPPPWLVTHSHRSRVARSPPHSPLQSLGRAVGVAVGVAPPASLGRVKGAVLGMDSGYPHVPMGSPMLLWDPCVPMGFPMPPWDPHTSTVPPRVTRAPTGTPSLCRVP